MTELYPLRLSANAGPADTVLCVENLDELPEKGQFIGLLDRGAPSEEKVLAVRGVRLSALHVLARGYDGTRAMAHTPWNQSQEAKQLASAISVGLGQMFATGMIQDFDPHRLERMEKFVFAPISEWIAEGEKKAEREWADEFV